MRKVEDANKGLEAQIKAQTRLIGLLGVVIILFGLLLPIVMKLWHLA